MNTDVSHQPLTGERLRDLRLTAELSQKQLARAAGLGRNTISAMENGGPITSRSERRLRAVFADLNPPPTALEQVRAELAELRSLVTALAGGAAA